MIFGALNSELFRIQVYSLSSKNLKLPEFKLGMNGDSDVGDLVMKVTDLRC